MQQIKEVYMLPYLRQYKKNSIALFTQIVAKYGNVILLKRLLGHRIYLINDPTYYKHIFFDKRDSYIKPNFYKLFYEVLGEGLILTAKYDIWKKDRAALNPVFLTDRIKEYIPIMAQVTENYLNLWQEYVDNKIAIKLDWEMTLITLKNLLATLFGEIPFEVNEVNRGFRELLRLQVDYNASLTKLSFILPTATRARYLKTKVNMHKIGDKLVQDCLAVPFQNNIIQILAKAYGNELPNEKLLLHLREEALTFIVAGHETTAATLDWLFIHLAKSPQIAEKAYEEIKQVLGTREPTYDDVKALVYTRAVILETLRLHPPIAMLGRKALEKDDLNGLPIEKDDLVLIPIYNLHRLPDYWENPEVFNPDRFLKPLDERHKFAFLPFGAGPRVCIGQQFAVTESTLVLALILRKYRLRLTSDAEIGIEKSIFLRPSSQVTMLVETIT